MAKVLIQHENENASQAKDNLLLWRARNEKRKRRMSRERKQKQKQSKPKDKHAKGKDKSQSGLSEVLPIGKVQHQQKTVKKREKEVGAGRWELGEGTKKGAWGVGVDKQLHI